MIAPLVCEKRDLPPSRTHHANKSHVSKRKRKRKHSNSAPLLSQQVSSEKHSLIEVRLNFFA